ncbi:MAG: AAA family ATPase, partial [Deltaproteobacteria bacterium]|nr:AAA family ATPase [Deltaproteobacteria bacterium]
LGAFDLSLVNATPALDRVVAGLAERRRGTLCLHGPPGTGKTAFVRHLADQLGTPLRAHRASDLLDMYVGQTEKRLAEAFAEAEREGAVLFLDEADSFLQRRSGAARSWEVTQVNELLVQIESFGGIFACSTNLMESLDPASLRRFALKIRFSPLTAAQRLTLFERTLGGADSREGLPRPDDLTARLGRIPGLAAGDFAAVVRRARILGLELDAEGLLAELLDECRYKDRDGDGRVAVGFGRGEG